ncbi:MAG: hypothetical protein NW203_08675 [Hyphomonadaceae bacterium]|nr:hypothetical protein [Hyphomonadaceae bacterium]
MRIAYLTGRAWRGAPLPPGALPSLEAPDFALVEAAAAARGAALSVRVWDDPDLSRADCDVALIRSCWDYPERSAEFLQALMRLEARGVRVMNAPAIVRWNGRKDYLIAAERAGMPVIPTLWADALDARSVAKAFDAFETAELVIKPQVGAGSRNTLRLQRNAWSEADLMRGPAGPAMLQPYLPSIETIGERSLVYFDGAFSHAVRKSPAPGHWFANALDARFEPWAPDEAARIVALRALSALPEKAIYARVDLVQGHTGDWLVIEIEAIEPYLFLRFAPEGAARLVDAVLRGAGA